MASAIRRMGGWLEDRTGLGAALRRTFEREVEGGARWSYVFGNALGILLAVQVVTGLVLMATYTPSVDDAWSSVFQIQHRVSAGWFVRGLHNYGGQALLAVVALHLLQVVVYGAYKRPREVSWWLALGFGGLVLALMITGYRLPWDQRTYWALMVELNVAQATPVVGPALAELVAGGARIGQSTLTRLYTLHVAVLPVLAVLVLAGHRALVRRHGYTPPHGIDRGRREPLFPGQMARDLAFVLLVLGAVTMVTVATRGIVMDGPAEPHRDYPARPEWFLMVLYVLRKMMPPGTGELVATVVVPGVTTLFLLALPFLDRKPTHRVGARLHVIVPFLLIGAGAAAITGMGYAEDASDDDYREALAAQTERSERAIELAHLGVPPGGPVEMLRNDPLTHGRDVYAQFCQSCHVLAGEGEREAPDHTGFGSRAWLMGLLTDPQSEHYFGNVDHEEEMPSQWERGEEELTAIVEFLVAEGRRPKEPPVDTELAAEGKTLFLRKCTNCHSYGEHEWFLIDGPHLEGWAGWEWTRRQIADPGSPLNYGELHEMPAFAGQLTDHDIDMVTEYLLLQRLEEPDFELEPPPPEED